MSLARYRFLRVLHHSWGAYLAIVVLMGVIGGTAIASFAAARATQSSFSTLLARSNPSDMNVTINAPDITSRLNRLPGVRKVEGAMYLNAFPYSSSGRPIFNSAYINSNISPLGSVHGEYFDQDRVSVVAGRMANPADAGEIMTTAYGERLMGWHLGERIRFAFYTYAQVGSAKFGTAAVRPEIIRDERLVGTIAFTNQVIQDSVDQSFTFILFTPAATAPLDTGTQYIQYVFRLNHGGAGVTKVEREIVAALPPGNTYNFHVTSVVVGEADRTLRPEALALGVFGVMALLGAVLTTVQLIARQLRLRREDQESLRALGATRRAIVGDALAGVVSATVAGTVLAALVALALSPLEPLGPVRPYLPAGVHVDAVVLGVGLAVLLGGSTLAGAALASWWAPGRRSAQGILAPRGPVLARFGATSGLPVSAVAGLHFALQPGRGRATAPVRSILVGVAVAVAMLGATLTYGSGLSTLVSRPALYGWNWNAALTSDQDVPPASEAVLAHSSIVAKWSPLSYANAQIDGLTVPILLVYPHESISPPLLAGHDVENRHQIVLGAATMAELHKKLGDTVVGGYGAKSDYPVYVPPTTMTIVGVATLPAVGSPTTLHTSMGIGAEIDTTIEPTAFQKAITSPYPTLNGPKLVVIRFRASASRAQRAALLRRASLAGNAAFAAIPNGAGNGDTVASLPVQYPAEILNYRSIGNTPLLLALVFAAGIAVAFALTIVASVRRRRRDLATLKTLGFTRRQIGAAIAWQATVSVLLGLVVGIPLGIVIGRWLWDLFAHQIYAVPDATVPALAIVILGVGALVLANVVAYFPSRSAARTRAALILRAE